MSIENPTLAHFRHFSSLLTHNYRVSSAQKYLIMQNKPNFPNALINVNSVLTKEYENVPLRRHRQNKPNSKPIQTQSNPISTQIRRKQTQSNPIFRAFHLTHAAYSPQSNPTCSELVEPISTQPPLSRRSLWRSRILSRRSLWRRRIEFLLFYHLTFNQFFIFKFTNQQIPDFDIRRPSHQKAGFFIGGNTVSPL